MIWNRATLPLSPPATPRMSQPPPSPAQPRFDDGFGSGGYLATSHPTAAQWQYSHGAYAHPTQLSAGPASTSVSQARPPLQSHKSFPGYSGATAQQAPAFVQYQQDVRPILTHPDPAFTTTQPLRPAFAENRNDLDVNDEEADLGDGDSDAEVSRVPMTNEELRAHKRRLKRFRLTHTQTRYLLSEFAKQPHPDGAHRERLSRTIPGLSPRQVQVWFQNRRAKMKRLNDDDRAQLMNSRALPANFDMTQALHPPHTIPRPKSEAAVSTAAHFTPVVGDGRPWPSTVTAPPVVSNYTASTPTDIGQPGGSTRFDFTPTVAASASVTRVASSDSPSVPRHATQNLYAPSQSAGVVPNLSINTRYGAPFVFGTQQPSWQQQFTFGSPQNQAVASMPYSGMSASSAHTLWTPQQDPRGSLSAQFFPPEAQPAPKIEHDQKDELKGLGLFQPQTPGYSFQEPYQPNVFPTSIPLTESPQARGVDSRRSSRAARIHDPSSGPRIDSVHGGSQFGEHPESQAEHSPPNAKRRRLD